MEGLREHKEHESPPQDKLWDDTLAAIEAFKKNSYKYGIPTRRPVSVVNKRRESPATTYTPATSLQPELDIEPKTVDEEKPTEKMSQAFTTSSEHVVSHSKDFPRTQPTSEDCTKEQAATSSEAQILKDETTPYSEGVHSPVKIEIQQSDSATESSDEVVYRQADMGRRGRNGKQKRANTESNGNAHTHTNGQKLGDGLIPTNGHTSGTTGQPQVPSSQNPPHNGRPVIPPSPRAQTNRQPVTPQPVKKENLKASSGITHSHPKKNMEEQSDSPESKPLDIKEELKRLQEEALVELGKKVLGIDKGGESQKFSLHLARQGPGVDPDSEITYQLRRMITYSMKLPAIAQNPQNTAKIVSEEESADGEEDDKDNLSNRPNSAGGQSEKGNDLSPVVENSKHRSDETTGDRVLHAKNGNDNEPSKALKTKVHEEAMQIDEQQFGALLCDWQYRPWHTYSDPHFVPQFRRWLDNTLRLGRLVDTKDKNFRNGAYHPNGVDGLEAPDFEEPKTLLDLSDPQTAAHYHETALGYTYNMNLHIEEEKAQKEEKERMQRQKVITQASTPKVHKPVVNENAPKANIYLRPVELKDVDSLVNLYNLYVKNTVRCVDLHLITHQDMVDRIDECEREKLPFIVAAERKPRFGYVLNGQQESVWGFASVCDFTGPQTANRYTAELEIFVRPDKKRLGIGRCLMDKILEICDSGYVAKRGYFFDCATNQRAIYCSGGNRTLIRLISIVHFAADDAAEYTWIRKWFESEYKFEEQGLLKGTGVNKNKLLNSSYLVRDSLHIPDSIIKAKK